MTHYHLERKRAAVDVYREVKRLKKESDGILHSAYEFASVAAGGASETQIRLWLKSDLSDDAILQKEDRRGAARALTNDEENLLLGFAICERTSLQSLTLAMLQKFCLSYIQKNVSLATLSRIMRESGFSSQRVISRSSRLVSPETVKEALSFIEEIRSYALPPSRLIFMDETGLWSNVVKPKSYHFVNWYDIII
jgi:hypothetical protein